MGQSLVGGLIGGAAGAIPHLLTGNIPAALALGGIGFVGGFASSYMAKQATADALSSAMDGGEPKFGGYNVNRRGSALHHQVVYGQTKTGGVVVFDDAHGSDGLPNTDDNRYLSRIIAYAGHEIESFEKIYMGRYELTLSGDSVTSAQEIDENGNAVDGSTNKFNNYIKVRQVTGGHTTSLNGSFTGFSTQWTANHKLLGIAHLAIIFEYADDVWEEGLPGVTALIKGKKVYDPRTTTTAWSDNPALIVRDFLTNSVYGLAEATTNIDDTLVSTAANVCEETIYPFLTDAVDIVSSTDYKIHTVGTTDFTAIGAANNNVGTVFTATGAGTGTGTAGKIEANVDKYTCNGAWTTSQAPVDVIAQLMTSCAGYLWYAQGKWRMKAGKYVAPTVTLTEDDLRSPISVATRHSRRDNFNAVRGTFRGPSTNYQFTDYPTVTAAAFVTTDGGLESTMDLALPFTDTPNEAQRLANIALEKNRSQITITGSFGLNAFSLQVGDNVNITNTRFGWTDKLFEVVAWSLSVEDYQLNVNLVLRETTTTTYDEVQNITVFESDNTNLPGALGETSVTIAAGSVGTTELADDAVNSDKIADDAVGTAQIADDAVNTDRIATGTASKMTFSSFGPGSYTIPKDATSALPDWKNVVSNSITGVDSGSKLLVTWNLVVDVAGSNAFKKFFVTLRNGNDVVWQTWPNSVDYNDGDDAMGVQDRATFSGSYVDTSPGSSETYTVSVTRGTGFSSDVYVERASVTITELRKPD